MEEKINEVIEAYQRCLDSTEVIEGINEDMYVYLYLSLKEFFNLKLGIVTPEFIEKIRPEGEMTIVDEVTVKVPIVGGKELEIKAALPPQGTLDGERWHGIPDLVKLLKD